MYLTNEMEEYFNVRRIAVEEYIKAFLAKHPDLQVHAFCAWYTCLQDTLHETDKAYWLTFASEHDNDL